jgi:hypothetical protein
LLKQGFEIGKADATLFTRKVYGHIFVCQIYVDDIIFGSTNECEEFSRVMTKRFEMSMIGELKFFIGFKIKQAKEGTFICQTKYTKDMLKKFNMDMAKPVKIPIPTNGYLDLNEEGNSVDQKVYHSMIGSLLYLCASSTTRKVFINDDFLVMLQTLVTEWYVFHDEMSIFVISCM